MGDVLSYKEEVIRAMELLAQDERVIFLGQNVLYTGGPTYETLQSVPDERKIELPVAEELQLGMSIGLALEGYIPVSIFPRMDFLMRAMDQLVNHLDKIEEMSAGRFRPKVIIRTMIGARYPLNPGAQHSQDHTTMLYNVLTNIKVVKLVFLDEIVNAYQEALESKQSTILVELAEKIREV